MTTPLRKKMASKKREKLPNLKICIDNDSSESDDDNLSLTEEPQISLDDEDTDKRIAVAAESADESGDEQHVLDNKPESEDVQFNVYLDRPEPRQDERNFTMPSRVFENKDGNFITGIDLSNKEEQEKREVRAKRFGIEKKELSPDVRELYLSLGLKLDDPDSRDERGIRLEAIHIQGVENLNTKDLFSYFQEFGAGGIEWIDDESCNVLWADRRTAARAMLKLSRSYDEVLGIKPKTEAKSKPSSTKPDTEPVSTDKSDDSRQEEKMEEDDDDLDLTEDMNTDNKATDGNTDHTTEKVTGNGDKHEEEKMEEEDMEEGEIADSDSETPEKSDIPWPPGKWRLGAPYQDKAKCLFLRFATKADVKIPGAEKRSKFFKRFGNPNFGGTKGLISNTMKQKMRNFAHREELVETFGVSEAGHNKIGNRNQISYGDDLFSDAITPVEVEEIEMYSKNEKLGIEKKKKKKFLSDEEDAAVAISEEENEYPVVEKVSSGHDERVGGSDSDGVDESELNRLLGRQKRKPMMRMYADDLEEERTAYRHRGAPGALTIVADAKMKRVKDARQLISGGDLRTALKEKKMNQQRMFDDEFRSRSGSRSPSPFVEQRKPAKHLSPIHMTIENSPKQRSPSPEPENKEEKEQEVEEEEEVEDEEEVAEMSEKEEESRPEPRPARHRSPIEFRSRMDETESPKKDIRSRLNRRPASGLKSEMQSVNSVKSRLSRRLSPKSVRRREEDEPSPDRRVRQRGVQDRSPEILKTRARRSPIEFRSNLRRSRSPFDRRSRVRRSRSPAYRRYNDRYRSPVGRRFGGRTRSPIGRRFNRPRSRSRSPLRRSPVSRRNFRSRSPVRDRRNWNRTRAGRDARSRLGRKSRSPTDTESDTDEPDRGKSVENSSSSSSSSSSSESSQESSSSSSDSSSSSSASSSSSSSESSSSSSSESESDSDASERSAIRNKKSQRKIPVDTRVREKRSDRQFDSRKQRSDPRREKNRSNAPRHKRRPRN